MENENVKPTPEAQEQEKDYTREIGGFRLNWEEASKENGNMPWLVIKAASGQWETRFRGDASVTLMWRRLLEEPSKNFEEVLHGQLRMMQDLNSSIYDPLTELFMQSLMVGHFYMLGKSAEEVSEYNTKRAGIADQLVKLVGALIPQPKTSDEKPPATEEEKEILKEMRTAKIDSDLNGEKADDSEEPQAEEK